MKANKILVIGHLVGSSSNGQETKTVDAINFFKEKGFEVEVLNYGNLSSVQKITRSFRAMRNNDKYVLMPGGFNALRFYLFLWGLFFKKREMHYLVVGGWITNIFQEKGLKRTVSRMKKIRRIYSENRSALDEFRSRGFQNASLVNTFSSRTPLTAQEFEDSKMAFIGNGAFNFCFMSRVAVQKGIFLACESIKALAEKYPEKTITLDIYGPVESDETKKTLEQYLGKTIRYCGFFEGSDLVKHLANYYGFLFPTFYPGEGTAHAVIEALMAGLPVIASDWRYNKEVIEDGKTGLIFDLAKEGDLTDKIEFAINNKDVVLRMKDNCYEASRQYTKETLNVIIEHFGRV